MAINVKSKVTAAKIESVFNVAEVLTNADTFEVKMSSKVDATLDTVERDVIRDSLLSLPPIPVRENTSGNLDFEIIPSGTLQELQGDALWEAGMGIKSAAGTATGAFIGFSDAGVTPADEIYLADVAEDGTAVAYLSGGASDATKSLTIKEFIGTDKSLETTGNVVSSIAINLPSADVANVSFSIEGCGFTTNNADTKLSNLCTSTLPYLGKSAVFKFDGSTVNATDVSINIANTVYNEEAITSDGYSSKQVTAKDITGSFTVLFEDYSLLTKFQDSVNGSLYISLTQGTGTFAVYIPVLRLTEFSKADSSGVYSQTVSFQVPANCDADVEPIIIAHITA